MPFDVFPAKFPTGEDGFLVADKVSGQTLPVGEAPRVYGLHVSARRACDALNSTHMPTRRAAWDRYGKGGNVLAAATNRPTTAKFVLAPALGGGFHVESAKNGSAALMPDGVTPIHFPDEGTAARFAGNTVEFFCRYAAFPPAEPEIREAYARAAAYYGYRMSDFMPNAPEDAPTAEVLVVPPDLTHALSELVMKYGPAAVKLAAERW